MPQRKRPDRSDPDGDAPAWGVSNFFPKKIWNFTRSGGAPTGFERALLRLKMPMALNAPSFHDVLHVHRDRRALNEAELRVQILRIPVGNQGHISRRRDIPQQPGVE